MISSQAATWNRPDFHAASASLSASRLNTRGSAPGAEKLRLCTFARSTKIFINFVLRRSGCYAILRPEPAGDCYGQVIPHQRRMSCLQAPAVAPKCCFRFLPNFKDRCRPTVPVDVDYFPPDARALGEGPRA